MQNSKSKTEIRKTSILVDLITAIIAVVIVGEPVMERGRSWRDYMGPRLPYLSCVQIYPTQLSSRTMYGFIL